MFKTIRQYYKLKSYANFWDYVRDRDNFSVDELQNLVDSITDCSLIRPWNPLGDRYFIDGKPSGQVLEETIHALYKRFSIEIWSACLGAGGYDAENGPCGLSCLAKLELSHQVHDQKTFEEFLVRNALKRAARDILEEQKGRIQSNTQ
jgi:hypothetical protein